jgi:hypothetical protein
MNEEIQFEDEPLKIRFHVSAGKFLGFLVHEHGI